METVDYLQQKRKLDASDAAALLQLIQEQAAPILSLRAAAAASSLAVPETKQAPIRTQASSRSRASRQALARSHHDKKRTQLDVNSLEEFPPMDSGTTSSKNSRKRSSKSSKPGRRITLTPVDSQSSAVAQFSASPSANVWASNPAFTRSSYSSFEGPASLTEERMLLRQEREKSKQKNRSRSRLTTSNRSREQTDSQHRSYLASSVSSSSARSGRNSPPSFGTHFYNSNVSESLDAKISSHSIFELCGSARNSSHSARAQPPEPSLHSQSKTEQTPPSIYNIISTESQDLDDPSSSLMVSTSRSTLLLPMTSSPLLDVHQPLVSPDAVTNQASLDGLAGLYAILITDRLVPNLTSEIHFVFQMLTVTVPDSSKFTGSHDLFDSIENCVYFAVSVLSKIKHILVALDKATLQLLSENVRVAEFKPQLTSFFREASERKGEGPSPPLSSSYSLSLSQDGRQSSVPFLEETDNSKNFPNTKAFHAFKKQRDAFYSALREWEKERGGPNWNMEDALAKRVQVVIKSPADLTSHAHFARLFQKQLVESCRCPVHAEGEVGTLARQLGKTDPQRLLKLNERFYLPRSTGCGPCPPPSFSATEEFFTTLIVVADSYSFNQHLKLALYAELHKLHSGCVSVQPSEAPDVVHTMRLLAKFLGFVEFLPYTNPSPDSVLAAREMAGCFDVHLCVFEARERGHLALTIPWVVELLSMMDTQAPSLKRNTELLTTLMAIYRDVQLSVVDGAGNDDFLVVTCLGWLFENPNISSSVFFDHLKKSHDGNTSTPMESEGLQGVVTTDLLYACCPFLGELRSMLNEFAAGLQTKASPIRKIKPIAVAVEGREGERGSAASPLQLQLHENFFRSHPPYLKQVCQIAAERTVASALAHCEDRITAQSVLVGAHTLAAWMRAKWLAASAQDSSDNTLEPFSRLEADRELAQAVDCAVQAATADSRLHCSEHCKLHAARALEGLLAGSMTDQVIATAAAIVSCWALEKCLKWIAEKPHVLVREQLSRNFDKMRKTVKIAKRKGDITPAHLQSSCQHTQGSRRGSDLRSPPSTATGVASSVDAFREGEGEGEEEEEEGGGEGSSFRRPAVLGALAGGRHLLEQFERVAEDAIKCESPSEEELLQLKAVLVRLTEAVDCGTSIIPSVHSPQLLPHGYDKAVTRSLELASALVAQAHFKARTGVGGELLGSLLRFWKLTKGLKLEVCVQHLMSAAAFKCYCQAADKQGPDDKAVWQSLSGVLLGAIESEVTSSPVVEGLWLCRRQQLLEQSNVLLWLTAAEVFLSEWHFPALRKHTSSAARELETLHTSSQGVVNKPASSIGGSAIADETRKEGAEGAEVGGVSFLGSGTFLREAHFGRLLAVVCRELPQYRDMPIPPELMTRDLSQVVKIIHPF